MQLKFQKDFIVRRATASDRLEVLALMRKYADPLAADSLDSEFQGLCSDPKVLFEVALNSNGVVIAFLYATKGEWRELAANPNFLKQELREMLYANVKNWAAQQSGGKLVFKPKLIAGDWKAFVKKQGAKIVAETIEF